MGGPIARHLAGAGHELTVYNRTASKAADWVAAHGGHAAATPAEAAVGQDVVMSCVGRDADLEAVTLGPDGAFAAMRAGALFVDHTTVSADIARRLDAEASARGVLSVDAPVSGGQAGAENGQLSIMCGGSDAAMAAAERGVASPGGCSGPEDSSVGWVRNASARAIRSMRSRARGSPSLPGR